MSAENKGCIKPLHGLNCKHCVLRYYREFRHTENRNGIDCHSRKTLLTLSTFQEKPRSGWSIARGSDMKVCFILPVNTDNQFQTLFTFLSKAARERSRPHVKGMVIWLAFRMHCIMRFHNLSHARLVLKHPQKGGLVYFLLKEQSVKKSHCGKNSWIWVMNYTS